MTKKKQPEVAKPAKRKLAKKVLKPGSKDGRPDKLDPERVSRMLTAIRASVYPDTAASFAGICKRTLHYWLKRGAEEKYGQYADFLHSYSEALAYAEAHMAIRVNSAGKADWRADAWMLERRFAARYARQDKVPLESINFDDLTEAELEHMAQTGEMPKRRQK